MGMQSTPSFLSLPGPFWPGVVAPDRGLSMGEIELNCILMLNWIVWNRTVLDIENWIVWIRNVLLNWIARNKNVFHNWSFNRYSVLMLKWIVWNKNVFFIKN